MTMQGSTRVWLEDGTYEALEQLRHEMEANRSAHDKTPLTHSDVLRTLLQRAGRLPGEERARGNGVQPVVRTGAYD